MGSTTGDLLWLVLLAFVFAWFAGAGVGWVLASHRWEKLLSGFLADARLERRELCTRIQGWSPEPEPATPARPAAAARPAGSQPAETADELTDEDLAERLIARDPGGEGFYCLHSKWLFDTVEDVEIWRSMLRYKKLPITLSPGTASDAGFSDAMAMARKLAEKQKQQRIAEESGQPEPATLEG